MPPPLARSWGEGSGYSGPSHAPFSNLEPSTPLTRFHHSTLKGGKWKGGEALFFFSFFCFHLPLHCPERN